jgi:hypothetical protein
VVLWGLLFGWWDGYFMLTYRTMGWMFLGLPTLLALPHVFVYGLDTGIGGVVSIVFDVLFSGIAGWMLYTTLDGDW